MPWRESEFTQKLQKAAEAYDRNKLEELCDQAVIHLRSRVEDYPVDAAKEDLKILRRKRHFDLMARLADAHLRAEQRDPMVSRDYAQALLDQGDVTGALAVLRSLLAQEDVPSRAYAEARGLIGRAYKQIYMDAKDSRVPGNRRALLSAFESYNMIYEADKDKYLWQGINAASLLFRARRDGIEVGKYPEPEGIAREVRGTVKGLIQDGEESMWDLATGAEAHVALGDWSDAGKLLRRYVEHPRIDAFELASTLRQLEEVWQLDQTEGDQRFLLDMLRGELLKRRGVLNTSPAQIHDKLGESSKSKEGLEALLGEERPLSHKWYFAGLDRSKGVARIWRGSRGVGTGFLLPGELLSEQWEGRQVLLTNNHVISRDPVYEITIRPEQARITFDVLNEGCADQPDYTVQEVLFESRVRDLDVTVLALNEKVKDVSPFPLAAVQPDKKEKDRIFVIGHPQGGELSFSLYDNMLLDFDATRIHYRSPTEPGSSGSPLFNAEWELIGIHHRGSKELGRLDDEGEVYPANEGIPLPAILAGVRQPVPA